MGYKKRMYFRRILRRRLDLFHVLLQIMIIRIVKAFGFLQELFRCKLLTFCFHPTCRDDTRFILLRKKRLFF